MANYNKIGQYFLLDYYRAQMHLYKIEKPVQTFSEDQD